MKTLLTTSIAKAAAFIRSGEIVAFPTETVYGLGGDAFRANAIQKIFEAKGRPVDNPLIVHIGEMDQIHGLVTRIPHAAEVFMTHFFPGPLTIIFERNPKVPSEVSAGLSTIGIRMPDHAIAASFLRECGTPVAAPSANLSGRPSPTTWQAVLHDLDGKIPCILAGNQTNIGLESTVVDCTGTPPVVLRTGAISTERLQKVWPDTIVADTNNLQLQRSPGTRYRHYSPHARVKVVTHPDEVEPTGSDAYIGLDSPGPGHSFGLSLVCQNLEQYAFELYHFFRTCDRSNIETIYCQAVEPTGIGRALMDRISRAAG